MFSKFVNKVLPVVIAIVLGSLAFTLLVGPAFGADGSAAAKKRYTCNKVRCLAYNSNGTARYSKILGVSYRTFVWSGTTVIGTKLSSGWLKQTGFQSQTVYYLSSNFK